MTQMPFALLYLNQLRGQLLIREQRAGLLPGVSVDSILVLEEAAPVGRAAFSSYAVNQVHLGNCLFMVFLN